MNKKAGRRTIHGGFTLIELLVVIIVVIVLTAILLPVFARARENARMTVCASNLHQVALALRMYANDWDGEYPPNDVRISSMFRERKQLVWNLLLPYTHSRRVFHCPDERSAFDRTLGYEYPVALWNEPGAWLQKPVRPDAGAVVALCEQHLERVGADGWTIDASGHEIGPVIFAREDGSTGRVMADQISGWAYQNGQWSELGPAACPAGAVCVLRFPGEQWPPQL